MTYSIMKTVAAVLAGAWGLFAVSGANVDFYQAPTAAPVTVYDDDPIVAPTSTTSTTTTVFPAWAGCDSVPLYAYRAGWADWDIETLMMVVRRESRCVPTAFNPTDPNGGSYGLTQINGFWCRPSKYWPQGWLQAHGIVGACDELYDPMTNLKAAYAIHRNSGWVPWRTADD
jgi:hypothetical protein